MKKITVIVPIYNVEKYIRTCFDSLLKQTMKDFVVLAINDGSPYHEQVIIDEYCQQYPILFKGIQKENGGYGSVLQLAIEQLETEYFLICDPDDFLADDALEHLLTLAEVSNADITIGAKNFIYNDDPIGDYDASYNKGYTTLKTNTVYNKDNSAFNDLFFVDPSPHSKLYRRSLAKNIKFPTKVGYTDNLLFYISLLNANKVLYTDKTCAYYLVDRIGNTMTDVRTAAFLGQIKVFKTIVDQASSLKPTSMFYYRMFESFNFLLEQSRRLKGNKEEYKQSLTELYTFVECLIPFNKEIIPFIDKYSKAKFIAKWRYKQLLNEKSSKKAYDKIMSLMVSEFVEKE